MRAPTQFLVLIHHAPFFEHIGKAASDDRVHALTNLAPWGDESNVSDADNRIAEEMDWLPTARDQDDPFYPGGVESRALSEDALNVAKSYRMEVYKAVLARLRNAEMSSLRAGPNNFEEAAKGAIAYAFRNAATEVALGFEGKWLEIADIYFRGHWRCGVTKRGKLVII